MWPASLRSVVPTVWPVGLFENYCKPLRGGMCHVPCATNRLMTGTIVVPAFWRVEWCHAGPDRTSRSGAIPENAWTHILTDKHGPANFFSPTHRRKSSFIRTCYAKALAPFILYDFGLGLCQSQSACAKCHRPILKRHRHLPEVGTLISASPIPIEPAVRTLFAKRLKIRSVPIGMCQVPHIDSR